MVGCVMKPLGYYLHRCSSRAGTTIGEDGGVCLVLDPAGLLQEQVAGMAATRKASA
jgi:chemotaxis protein histidine kinase CheA